MHQLRDAEIRDLQAARADIYSLGVVLYELLTGGYRRRCTADQCLIAAQMNTAVCLPLASAP